MAKFKNDILDDDFTLIQKVLAGDKTNFNILMLRYTQLVNSYTYQMVNDRDQVKDVTQEVFIRAYKQLHKFDMKSEFSTWLLRIATNIFLSHKDLRKKQVKFPNITNFYNEIENYKNDILEVNLDFLDEESSRLNISNSVKRAVDNLPSRQKTAFILKHYEGYKITEIAQKLNVKEGTANKYLLDALRQLRKNLTHLYEDVAVKLEKKSPEIDPEIWQYLRKQLLIDVKLGDKEDPSKVKELRLLVEELRLNVKEYLNKTNLSKKDFMNKTSEIFKDIKEADNDDVFLSGVWVGYILSNVEKSLTKSQTLLNSLTNTFLRMEKKIEGVE